MVHRLRGRIAATCEDVSLRRDSMKEFGNKPPYRSGRSGAGHGLGWTSLVIVKSDTAVTAANLKWKNRNNQVSRGSLCMLNKMYMYVAIIGTDYDHERWR